MKAKQLAPLAIALLCATAGAQQMYKYVAPDGTVSYTDKPPPATATKVEKKSAGGGGAASYDDLPYELAQAARKSPVTLYTSLSCPPCDQGRKYLNDHGIPFSEKTISTGDDAAQFTKVTGASTVPVMSVGSSKQQGFSADQWNTALTSNGYPTNNQMPKSHRNPAPEPLVAAKVDAKPADAAPSAPAPTPAPAPASDPGAQPGFHF